MSLSSSESSTSSSKTKVEQTNGTTTIIVSNNHPPDSPDSPDSAEKKAGRRKITIEFIDDKSRRHITFSKRKAGIMKKAYELSTLTGTQVLLLVASETGHVYTFATPKLQPLITKPEGKNLIQACLNTPDAPQQQQQQQPQQTQTPSQSQQTSQSSSTSSSSASRQSNSFPDGYADADGGFDDEKKHSMAETKPTFPSLSGLDMAAFGYNPQLLAAANNRQYMASLASGGLPQGYPQLMRAPAQGYPQYPPNLYQQQPNLQQQQQQLPPSPQQQQLTPQQQQQLLQSQQQQQQPSYYWPKGPGGVAGPPMQMPFFPPQGPPQGPNKP